MLESPELVLGHISEKKAAFTRTDILRTLAKQLDNPVQLKTATDRAMASSELVKIDNQDGIAVFTTRGYQSAECTLDQTAKEMSSMGGFAVDRAFVKQAVKTQNKDTLSQNGLMNQYKVHTSKSIALRRVCPLMMLKAC